MARNVEIKARIADIAALEAVVARLADRGPTFIAQDDTFFHCTHGRLKLREVADGSAELIAYQRPDATGPKVSTYVRSPVPDAAGMRLALMAACGLCGRVRKQRTLYLIGPTRVHLDVVEDLGYFVELEVVLREGQPVDEGTSVAAALLADLRIMPSQLVAQAYVDLLAQAACGRPVPSGRTGRSG